MLVPDLEDYRPDGSGRSPLARSEVIYRTTCPECGSEARRETDVSDNFLCSAWYFYRYPATDFDDRPFDDGLTKKWLPVDLYVGGNEHAVLHLLYSRFLCMAFHEMGLIDFEEPFKKFVAHGMIIRDGAKMSKSKGNVVNPDEYIQEYGADAFRVYLMFMGAYLEGGDFRDEGVRAMRSFLDRVYANIAVHELTGSPPEDQETLYWMQETIEYVVQINGKVRAKFEIKAGTSQAEIEAKVIEEPRVKNWVEGKGIVKKIFVPNKLVNIVVK